MNKKLEEIIIFKKWDKVLYNKWDENNIFIATDWAIIEKKFLFWAKLNKIIFFWCIFKEHNIDYKINYCHLKNCFFDELFFWNHSEYLSDWKIDISLPKMNYSIDTILLELNTNNIKEDNENFDFNKLKNKLEESKITFLRIWIKNLIILPSIYSTIKELNLFWIYNSDKSNIKIWKLKIKLLNISFSNLIEWLQFENLEIDELRISNSNLWKTTFNWVKINRLYLENTTLNDCVFNWVEFPKNYELEKIENEKKEIDYKKMKDNYRQLKFVMDKNWNYTEANRFFEKEMEYYGKELKENWWWQERFILWIQKEISFFWKNWFKVILLIITLALITDIINYCYISNSFEWWIYEPKQFWKLFFNLLYPLYWLWENFIKNFDIPLIIGFMSYKIIYWTLLWHLWVALKRTTKR